ncbi:MAG: FG-GAP-like repeat-containing protein [Candidatus Eisenbacteria bacterium]|nr:FG-GAP-like repeat-containing protein [Candidatus Eisenbacteria bacterium]
MTLATSFRRTALPTLLLVTLLTLASLPPPARAANEPGPNLMGSGSALMDYDRDGDLDLFFMTVRDGKVEIFQNQGNMTFIDVTFQVMGNIRFNANGMGFGCGDLNNDGWEDFLVTFGPYPPNQPSTPYRAFLNNGNGTFREITRAAGFTSYKAGVLSSSVAFFDYDRDSDLDVYIGNYIEIIPKEGGDVTLIGAKNHFYENVGNLPDGTPQFIDKTDEKGIGWCGGQSEWTLGVATGDYDNDGDMDLYVANDYGGINEDQSIRDGDDALFRNNGDATFTNVTIEAGGLDKGYTMGVDFGDYDNDGDLDVFLANFWQDSILENDGDGTFSWHRDDLGLTENLNGWGAAFRDYDNDGDLDILNVNGWIANGWGQVECEGNALWENRGPDAPVRFVNRVVDAGIQDFGDARGAAFGDLNKDGWVDMVVQNNLDWNHSENCPYEAGSRLIFLNNRNRTFDEVSKAAGIRTEGEDVAPGAGGPILNNHYLVIEPHGTISNRTAIGTRITIEVAGQIQMQEIGAGSYMSSHERCAFFGLGAATLVDRVTIRWPNGLVEIMENVAADQRLSVTEGFVPVRLLSLEASAVTDGIEISWSFTDAVDHAGFQIERRHDASEWITVSDRLLSGDESRMSWIDRTADVGIAYQYQLAAIGRNGDIERFGPVSATRSSAPKPLVLLQNRPNPFNPLTMIPIEGKRDAGEAIQIFGADGRLVRRLAVAPGIDAVEIAWDGTDDAGHILPSGTYFYRLASRPASARRMVMVK